MGPNFFQTIMGRKFFEGTIPSILRQVDRLNTNLERMIVLMEESMETHEHKEEEQDE